MREKRPTMLRTWVAGKPILKVKKHSVHARIPERGSSKAAGYDLYSAHEYCVPANGKELVHTDISVAIPEGLYAILKEEIFVLRS